MVKLIKYLILVFIILIGVIVLITTRDSAYFINYTNNEIGHSGQIKFMIPIILKVVGSKSTSVRETDSSLSHYRMPPHI